MAAYFEDTKNYLAPKEYFLARLRSIAASGLRLSLASEEKLPDGAVFYIKHGPTAKSFGERITVRLTYLENGVRISVRSQCVMPLQMIDFGKNRNNVVAVFRYLDADVGKIPR